MKINLNKKIDNFFEEYLSVLKRSHTNHKNLVDLINKLKKIKSRKKVHIFGNGGSATIASHFSMDLTNNTKIKCLNYNDPAIISCYANDFGFQNWISKAVENYGESGDVIILVSSSGKSKNMLNAVKSARKKKIKTVVTFTGFNKNNPLKKLGDLNIWVNSKNYNIVENIHQFLLLTIVDILKTTITK